MRWMILPLLAACQAQAPARAPERADCDQCEQRQPPGRLPVPPSARTLPRLMDGFHRAKERAE